MCFFQFGERTKDLLSVYGTSSPAWKRGPLAPVVVVGEGQVNLVYGRRLPAASHGQSLQSFVVDPFDDESNRSPPVAIPAAIRLRNSHEINSRATGGSCSAC